MRELHELFHKNILINWLKVIILSCVMFYTSLVKTEILGSFAMMLTALAILSPLTIFYLNRYFPRNIKWLINNNFNRKELIQFHLFSQGMSLLLFSVHVAILILLFAVVKEKASLTSEFVFEPYSHLDLYYFYLVGGSLVFVVTSMSLFSSNKDLVSIQASAKKTTIRGKLKAIFILAAFLYLISFLLGGDVPEFIMFLLVSSFGAATSVYVFNRSFKIFDKRKNTKVAIALGLLYLAPYCVIYNLLYAELRDPEVTYKKRLDSLSVLGSLSGKFSLEEMKGYLDASKSGRSFKATLNVFKNNISDVEKFKAAASDKQFLGLTRFYAEVEIQQQEELVERLSTYALENKLSLKILKKTLGLVKKLKFSDQQVESMLASKDLYKQYMSIVSIARGKKLKDVERMFQENEQVLRKELRPYAKELLKKKKSRSNS